MKPRWAVAGAALVATLAGEVWAGLSRGVGPPELAVRNAGATAGAAHTIDCHGGLACVVDAAVVGLTVAEPPDCPTGYVATWPDGGAGWTCTATIAFAQLAGEPVCAVGEALTRTDAGPGCTDEITYSSTTGAWATTPAGCDAGQVMIAQKETGNAICVVDSPGLDNSAHPLCAGGYVMSNSDAGSACVADDKGTLGNSMHPLCPTGQVLTNSDAGTICVADQTGGGGGGLPLCASGQYVFNNDGGPACVVDSRSGGGLPLCASGNAVANNDGGAACVSTVDNITGTLALARITDDGTASKPLLSGGGSGDPAWSTLTCSGTDKLTSSSGVISCATDQTASTETISILASDYTTTTGLASTGITWTVGATKDTSFFCWLEVQDQASTVGIRFDTSHSQTPVRFFGRGMIYKTTTTAQTTEVQTATATTLPASACTSSCSTSSKGWVWQGTIEGHATLSDTVTLRAISATAGAKVKAGSYCRVVTN